MATIIEQLEAAMDFLHTAENRAYVAKDEAHTARVRAELAEKNAAEALENVKQALGKLGQLWKELDATTKRKCDACRGTGEALALPGARCGNCHGTGQLGPQAAPTSAVEGDEPTDGIHTECCGTCGQMFRTDKPLRLNEGRPEANDCPACEAKAERS